MSFLQRVRKFLTAPTPLNRAGERRPTTGPRPEAAAEDLLRDHLRRDPNDAMAFGALAALVGRRAATSGESDDPLTAESVIDDVERERRSDLAVWALAEELAGHPKAWFPLIELARLSLDDDQEGALRRLATAAERDGSGDALAAGLRLLRETGHPAEAFGHGVGHWRVKEHNPESGRQLVLAAIESGRVGEARLHLDSMAASDDPRVKRIVEALTPLLERTARAGTD